MMHHAIDACRQGIAQGQTPFGCAIVKEDRPIAAAHNTVWCDLDVTAHAEINAIRAACRELGRVDLTGCDLEPTCEPCPMCLAASHWARIDTVYFGATIADAQAARFNELDLAARRMVELGGSALRVVGPVLQDECAVLFDEWQRQANPQSY